MAKHNSIDLPAGSQDLSSHFYQYHRQTGGIWYIKNSNGQFLDCSNDFLRVFCSLNDVSQDEFLQNQPGNLFGFYDRKLKEYECLTIAENKIKILLVSLLSIDRTCPYICTLKPFLDGVYVKIDTLHFLGTERKIIDAICNINKKNISELYKHQRFYGVNPFLDLDPDDWLVAWLMSARVSQRSIAEFMNVNVKAIEKRASTIYTQLIVENYENFILLSDLYQWSKFIPPRISMSPVLNEVCLI